LQCSCVRRYWKHFRYSTNDTKNIDSRISLVREACHLLEESHYKIITTDDYHCAGAKNAIPAMISNILARPLDKEILILKLKERHTRNAIGRGEGNEQKHMFNYRDRYELRDNINIQASNFLAIRLKRW
jgi:2C-methyl-D-erythritol 2,4-cyclodiphosphate synthase